MSAEICTVTVADVEPWVRSRGATFLQDPGKAFTDADSRWWESFWDPSRTRGAVQDGRWVATLRTFATTITVPGSPGGPMAQVSADALTNVTVAGTHRRQGLLRRMLMPSLAEAKERGETVSILRAAEWPIYGRFGYWPSTWAADYRVRCDRQTPIFADPGLHIREITVAEAAALGPELYDQMRTGQAGHIERSRSLWQRRLGTAGVPRSVTRQPHCIIAEAADDGTVHGLLTWTATEGDWSRQQVDACVHDLITVSPAGYRTLWNYLIHLDLVTSINFDERATDEPLPWLVGDGRLVRLTGTEDAVWLRLLDVPAALTARRYAAVDKLVIKVVDDDTGGWAAGTFTLDGGPDHAQCVRTPTGTADLTMSQRALAAVYLGGNSVRSQQLAGLIDERSPGAVTRLELMLHTAGQPWNATGF